MYEKIYIYTQHKNNGGIGNRTLCELTPSPHLSSATTLLVYTTSSFSLSLFLSFLVIGRLLSPSSLTSTYLFLLSTVFSYYYCYYFLLSSSFLSGTASYHLLVNFPSTPSLLPSIASVTPYCSHFPTPCYEKKNHPAVTLGLRCHPTCPRSSQVSRLTLPQQPKCHGRRKY